MSDFDFIIGQLDKTPLQPKPGRWLALPELRSENEFSDTGVVPDQPHSSASNFSFSTVTKQVKKKKVSKKSKKDRIAEKSISLAERVGQPAPK